MEIILIDPFDRFQTAPISNLIEDLFIDGSYFGMIYGSYCYLPIFQHLLDVDGDETYKFDYWVGQQFF